jgi:MFS family permease
MRTLPAQVADATQRMPRDSSVVPARWTAGPLYAGATFVSAFLLFQVQPIFGKYILPWYGGSAGVWTTCMLFYTSALMIGYLYVHLSRQRLTSRAQRLVHATLFVAACMLLPIIPSEIWKPAPERAPVGQILSTLTVCLGLPYVVLSATSPLLQAWWSDRFPDRRSYRLYAFSNAGSLLGVMTYPFLVEPTLSRLHQARLWSWGFLIAGVLVAGIASIGLRRAPWESRSGKAGHDTSSAVPASRRTRAIWLGLSALAVATLLAVTNQICQDMAVVPLLWVLPLSAYLLTFIICFARNDRPRSRLWLGSVLIATAAMIWLLYKMDHEVDIVLQVTLPTLFLFCVGMVCHRELYLRRPDEGQLTAFYLMIAAGGAIGALFVAIVAPLIFPIYLEMHVCVVAACGVAIGLLMASADRRVYGSERLVMRRVLTVGVVIVVAAFLVHQVSGRVSRNITARRNFYGVITVADGPGMLKGRTVRAMIHGGITHGIQILPLESLHDPASYFGRDSGVGRLMDVITESHRKIGVVGLGAGTLAEYGRHGDRLRFYEVNPEVEPLARTYFSYLNRAEAHVEIVTGDARLVMEREVPQQYDVIILDAFTGGAPPVHLLTLEAFRVYQRHLRPHGAIAVNVSNRHLDLYPVVRRSAAVLGLDVALVGNLEDASREVYGADWMLMSDRTVLDVPQIHEVEIAPEDDPPGFTPWTDERASLLPIITM